MLNCKYTGETKGGFNNSFGQSWRSENQKDSYDVKLTVMIINWQLWSYADSYDHTSSTWKYGLKTEVKARI